MTTPAATTTDAPPDRHLVVFELRGQSYGIDISATREIIRCQEVTKVPGVPDSVEGIINLRGSVIPVVDLPERLGLGAWHQTDESRIMVLELQDSTIGVIVDAVTEVQRIPGSSIEEPSRMVSRSVESSYIEGIAKLENELLILLDLNSALSTEAIRSFKAPSDIEPVVADAADESEADAPAEEEAEVPAEESDTGGLPLNVPLLEETFALLAPRGEELVEDFYARLFEQHPGVQPMFENTDMREQQHKLLGALATVVKTLRKPDELVPVLQELGVRHLEIGAEAAHYDAVGGVLLQSMAAIAGDAWTEEIEQAWAEAYQLVASVMIEAAADAADVQAAA